MKLWTHQEFALQEITKVSKGIINHFCGTGKTEIIIGRLLKVSKGNIGIVVIPSLTLIAQFNQLFITKNKKIKILTVCSKDDRQDPNNDQLEITTSESDICKFLTTKKKKRKVITVTYHSFDVLFESITKIKTTLEVVMFDEAHHVCNQIGVQTLFKIEKLSKQCLFFTATTKTANNVFMGDKIKNCIDFDCGPIISRFTHQDALLTNPPICRDFQVIVDFGTSESTLYESIVRAMISTGNNRMLSFHTTVKSGVNGFSETQFKNAVHHILATEFQEKLGMYQDQSHFQVISFSTTTKKRNQKLQFFNSRPDIDKLKTDNWLILIVSCETISEGIDVQNCNGVVFADPRQSYIKIIQNIGRCCRLPVGKDNIGPSTILLPILVNQEKYKLATDDQSRDNIFKKDLGEDFRTILNVYAALRQSDPDAYKECLFQMMGTPIVESNTKKLFQNSSNLKTCEKMLPNSTPKYFNVRQSCDLDILWNVQTLCENLSKHTQSAIVDCIVLRKTFNQRCDELEEFLQKNQRYPKRESNSKHENYLYHFVGDIKKQKKGKRTNYRLLTEMEIARLEKIPNWNWEKDPLKEFEKHIDEFKQYYKEHKISPSAGTPLGNWVMAIRQMKKGSRYSTLDEEKLKLIAETQGWLWEQEDKYDEKVLAYKKFIEKNNRHPTKNKNADIEEVKLAHWKSDRNEDKHKGKLTVEREAELLQLFGSWSEKRKTKIKSFEQWCDSYLNFIQQKSYHPLSGSSDIEEKQIAKWIGAIRSKYHKKTLTKEQIDILEKLPQWKWKDETRSRPVLFVDRCEQYKDFYRLHGETPKYKGKPNEKELSAWISRMRNAYKNTSLIQNQIETLETLPKWHWSNEKNEKNDTNVPTNNLTQSLENESKVTFPATCEPTIPQMTKDKKDIVLKNIEKQIESLKRKRDIITNEEDNDDTVEIMKEYQDSYDDSTHSEEHVIWKQEMNDRFRNLLLHNIAENSNVIYLDSETMHTTQTLQDTSFHLYVPNDNYDVFTKISKNPRIHTCCNSASNALKLEWKNIVFSACYFDACTGTANVLLEMLDVFICSVPKHIDIVVGFTITRRDPYGESHLARVYKIKEYLRKHGNISYSEESIHEAVATEFHVIRFHDI
jgi:superfamily II DNA or RNA helicase